VKRLLRLAWPSDYCALLLFYAGTNEAARGDLNMSNVTTGHWW